MIEPTDPKFKNVYEPAEDSKLLLKYSLKEIENKKDLDIIEIGVGSGFVISNLANENPNNNYFGTDINPDAINLTKKENSKIKVKLGNLFEISQISKSNSLTFENKKFDLILFNTPYFPVEDGESFDKLSLKDRAIYGGEKGWETIKEFVIESKKHFKENGVGIMIFSSLSNLDMIKRILSENLFEFEILKEENSFFEKIYCMKFFPLKILTELENVGFEKIQFLAKGKHSIVLEGKYQREDCIAKVGKFKDIQIENEFLERLENEGFVPRLFLGRKNYSIREKFKGEMIKDFIKKANNKDLEIVIDKILKITQRLDELGINKQEMTNPYKHIFINDELEVKMIDYERCLFTDKPKNTTQFLQYLRRNILELKKKGFTLSLEKIFDVSKEIKKKNKQISLKDILD